MSGTRLKHLRAAAGDPVSLGLFDSQLGASCTPIGLGAGVRCVPLGLPIGLRLYADAACTTPILLFLAGPPIVGAPTLVADLAADQCGCQIAGPSCTGGIAAGVVTVGATTTVPQAYATVSGTCTGLGSPPAGSTFAVGADLTTTYATASADQLSDGRLAVARFTFEDGAVACGDDLPLQDALLGDACRPIRADDGQVRCLPDATSSISARRDAFTDAACSVAASFLVVRDSCATIPTGMLERADTAIGECASGASVRQLTRASAFGRDGLGECGPLTAMGQIYLARGPRQPADLFAAADVRRLPWVAGFDRRVLAFESGLDLPDRALQLTALGGVHCALAAARPGPVACVPEDAVDAPLGGVLDAFTDAACTAPLRVGVTTCAGVAPAAVTDGTSYYPVAGAHAGALYGGSGCAAIVLPTYVLGAPLTLATLPVLTLVSDE